MENKFKYYRTQSKLSQTELATKLFVTRQAVSKWELGKAIPDIDTIKKLTEIYNCSFDDLLDGDNTTLSIQNSNIALQKNNKLLKLVIIMMTILLITTTALAVVIPIIVSNKNTDKQISESIEKAFNSKKTRLNVIGVYIEVNGDGKFDISELDSPREDNCNVMFDPNLNHLAVTSHNFSLFTLMDGNTKDSANFNEGNRWYDIYGTSTLTLAKGSYIDYWRIIDNNGVLEKKYCGNIPIRTDGAEGCIVVSDKDDYGYGSYFYILYG